MAVCVSTFRGDQNRVSFVVVEHVKTRHVKKEAIINHIKPPVCERGLFCSQRGVEVCGGMNVYE